MNRFALGLTALAAGFLASAAWAADNASGTVAYKSRTATVKYAYLIKGPDAVDPKVMVRELILSSSDIGTKLAACKSMSCASGLLQEGMTLDFGPGPRLNYWIVLNNQMVQYSGTAQPAVLQARQNDPTRLAGKLAIDDTAAGGPRISVEFDAALVKEFSAAR
jgi:hypothetical protein